jgi:NAD(P)H-dependent FMN reductase
MILVISGTDRPNSRTAMVAKHCALVAEKQGEDVLLLGLESIDPSFYAESRYGAPSEGFAQVFHNTIIPSAQIVIIVPEYNGSFPGILKYFIDLTPPEIWRGKKVGLIGLATGRAGNIRGIDHLTAVLHYLRAEVYSQKVYLSSLHQHSDTEGLLVSSDYLLQIDCLIEGLMKF